MKNFKLYGSYALQMIGMDLGISAVMSIFSLFMNKRLFNGSYIESFLLIFSIFTVLINIVMTVVSSGSTYQLIVPMSMTLNATRKQSFIGIQIEKILLTVWSIPVLLLFSKVSDGVIGSGIGKLVVLVCCLTLTAGNLGEVFGVIYLRFGKIGVILLAILGGIAGGCVGAGFSLIILSKGKDRMAALMSHLETRILGIVLAATAVFMVVTVIASWSMLKKSEARL